MKTLRHLMSPTDFTVDELEDLFDVAVDIKKNMSAYSHLCDGKVLATCFYEPSTRTRLSFETAMIRLGGKCIGFSDASSSSASKGESVADTVRTISCFADICAMRHPKEGAPMVAASKSLIPVINGGDGGHHRRFEIWQDRPFSHSCAHQIQRHPLHLYLSSRAASPRLYHGQT